MRMQVILDSSFARPGSAPIWGGKKGEFRDWTILRHDRAAESSLVLEHAARASPFFIKKTGQCLRIRKVGWNVVWLF